MVDETRSGPGGWADEPQRPLQGRPVSGPPSDAHSTGYQPPLHYGDEPFPPGQQAFAQPGYPAPDSHSPWAPPIPEAPVTAPPAQPTSGAGRGGMISDIAGSAAVTGVGRVIRNVMGGGNSEQTTGAPAGVSGLGSAASTSAAAAGRSWQSRAGLGVGYAAGAGVGFSGGKDLVNAARGKVDPDQSRLKVAFKGVAKIAVSVGAVMATEQARKNGLGSLVPSFARGR